MSAELALQGALNVLWRGNAAVGALVGDRIYDRVPDTRAFPYVKLDASYSADADTGCSARREVFLDAHVYSEAVGKVEAKRIMGALEAAVWAADRASVLLTSDGYLINHLRVADTRTIEEPDSLRSRGIVTVEAVITPISD